MILTLGLIIEGEIFLVLSLSLSPSVLHLSNELSLLARRAVFFFFVLLLLLLLLSFPLSLSLDDDDDDVFTTLFIRSFLSRADIFLLSLSSSCVHRPLLK